MQSIAKQGIAKQNIVKHSKTKKHMQCNTIKYKANFQKTVTCDTANAKQCTAKQRIAKKSTATHRNAKQSKLSPETVTCDILFPSSGKAIMCHMPRLRDI